MDICDILDKDRVYLSLKAKSKRQALEELAKHAAEATGVSERQIIDVLLERERLGTTGVGGGIAIPHGKLPDLERTFCAFARLSERVNFDSIDEEHVDLLFLLLAPEASGTESLKILSRVSRLLRDGLICEKLRSAPTPESAYELLADHHLNRAA